MSQAPGGFFEVLFHPKAYTSALYLMISMVTGIIAFTWAVTGISLSLGLLVLIIGLPFALAFLVSARGLAQVELALMDGLLDANLPRPAPLLPRGDSFLLRLKHLVCDRLTWTTLLFQLAQLPLGLFYFTLMTVLASLGLGFLAAPFARFAGHGVLQVEGLPDQLSWIAAHPTQTSLLCALAGLLLLPGTLHAALFLGRFQAWLAGKLLVRA